MARLLVKAVDYAHPDPKIDAQGAYKRGDVVCVMPDGHVWGRAEGAPKFEHIDFPGAKVEDLIHLVGAEVESLAEVVSIALRKNPKLLRMVARTKPRQTKTRRRYKLNLDGGNAVIDKTRN